MEDRKDNPADPDPKEKDTSEEQQYQEKSGKDEAATRDDRSPKRPSGEISE